MDDLLQNPAVQAAVLPFAVAAAICAVLSRTRLLGLAQVAGFLVLAALAIGFSFESLTSTKKLVLIGMGTALATLALEWRASGPPSRAARAALPIALGTATVWMLWRLLAQKETGPALWAGALACAYVLALVEGTLRVSTDPVRGASTGLMLGLGTGALAVLGGSALLGLVGIALGASAGATLLIQMLRGRPAEAAVTIALPAAALAALAGVLAVLSASLPWFCLPPLLAVPWATRLVPPTAHRVWGRAVLCSLAAAVPVLLAVAIAWTASAPA